MEKTKNNKSTPAKKSPLKKIHKKKINRKVIVLSGGAPKTLEQKQDFGIGPYLDRCWTRRQNLITKYMRAGKTHFEAADLADERIHGLEFVAQKKHERDAEELKFQQNQKATYEKYIKANQKNEDYIEKWNQLAALKRLAALKAKTRK